MLSEEYDAIVGQNIVNGEIVYKNITPEVAKYERVARAAKEIFGVEGMKNLRPLYEELEAALADLPEGALRG